MHIAASSSASADDAASSNANTPAGEGQASRQSNLQRIQQRKQQVYNWPHNKKLLKLAIYSACQVSINRYLLASTYVNWGIFELRSWILYFHTYLFRVLITIENEHENKIFHKQDYSLLDLLGNIINKKIVQAQLFGSVTTL